MHVSTLIFSLALLLASTVSVAETEQDHVIELESTVIHGNKEQPQILYIVPWKEHNDRQKNIDQKLVLHSLFGYIFEPVTPTKILEE